jgi:proline iminopeptidase
MKLTFSIFAFFFCTNFCIGQTTKDSFYNKKIIEKGVKFIPVCNGKYKVFTQKIGDGKIKLLLLHGGPVNTHEYFENFPENLKNTGIEIYYYDQLGSYYSDQPNDTSIWKVDRFVDEVEEVRKGLNLKNFYILGHSWGAMLAELYAAKYGNDLKGLILSNTPVYIRDMAKIKESDRARITNINRLIKSLPEFGKISALTMDSIIGKIRITDTVLNASLAKVYTVKYDSIFGRNFTYRGQVRPEPLVRTGFHIDRLGREKSGIIPRIREPDYPAAMEQIKSPVLIIGGNYDRMNQEFYPEMKKQFSKAKVRIYICPNGSHFSMWDDSENYFREVIRFLKDVHGNSFDPDN